MFCDDFKLMPLQSNAILLFNINLIKRKKRLIFFNKYIIFTLNLTPSIQTDINTIQTYIIYQQSSLIFNKYLYCPNKHQFAFALKKVSEAETCWHVFNGQPSLNKGFLTSIPCECLRTAVYLENIWDLLAEERQRNKSLNTQVALPLTHLWKYLYYYYFHSVLLTFCPVICKLVHFLKEEIYNLGGVDVFILD